MQENGIIETIDENIKWATKSVSMQTNYAPSVEKACCITSTLLEKKNYNMISPKVF